MLHDFVRWFLESQEYQRFGWNLATISAGGTMFFAVLMIVFSLRQNRDIWRGRSAEGIEMSMFGYMCAYAFTFGYYGIFTHSLAAVINSTVGLSYIPILIGISMFRKDIRRRDIAIALLLGAGMVVGMVLTEEKDLLLMVYLFGILFFLGKQAWTVWITGTMGDLSPGYAWVFFLQSGVWLAYAIKVDAWPLEVFNGVAMIIFLLILKPWFVRKGHERY